jgi:hypothetical protein
MPPSRRTTSQIISLGQYLDADFDPTSLTVPQILGILLYHKVKYPTRYSKKELVHIFNSKIKPRSAVFKNERITQENVTGSNDGIEDGLTGLSPTLVQYVMFVVISVPSSCLLVDHPADNLKSNLLVLEPRPQWMWTWRWRRGLTS